MSNKKLLEVGMKVKLLKVGGSWENLQDFIDDESKVSTFYRENGFLIVRRFIFDWHGKEKVSIGCEIDREYWYIDVDYDDIEIIDKL